MKQLIFFFTPSVILVSLFACNNGGTSTSDCKLSKEDSIRIARDIAKRYPDTVPTYSAKFKSMQYKAPSTIIDDRTAVREHLNYLINGGIADSDGNTLHSVWIAKSELQTVVENAGRGARLSFCLNTEAGKTYLGLIMTPIDANGRNVLKDGQNRFIIVNKVEPCPDKCPEGDFETTTNDQNDLNYDKYGDFGNQGKWYKKGKWVDVNNN